MDATKNDKTKLENASNCNDNVIDKWEEDNDEELLLACCHSIGM